MQVDPPQHPLPEEHFDRDSLADRCVTNPPYTRVYGENSIGVHVDVVSDRQGYMRVEGTQPINLDYHSPGWGMIYIGVILRDFKEHHYVTPNEGEAQKVVIKRLSKAVVNAYLGRGGNENPWKEIQRMKWLGDNRHVLGLVEALQDDEYLYIITPYCEGGDLAELSFRRRDRIEGLCGGFAAVYHNILENIEYLHRHGVCHRDLSPDNCLVLGNGRIVFNDLAMSFRIPSGDLTTRIGNFGKIPYLPPEVVVPDQPCFGATACDLWSSIVILFNLVTGEFAWERSLPTDLRFRYLVMAGGLSRFATNERAVEILADYPEMADVKKLAEKCMVLNPCVSGLLNGVLKWDPQERWNTTQVRDCIWLQAFRALQ